VTPETTTTTIAVPVGLRVQPSRPPITAPKTAAESVRSGPFPAWLRAVDTIHRADRSPIAVGADVFVAAICAIATGVSPTFAAAMAIGTALVVYLSGGYADRGPLETQGVLWFATKALSAVAFATLVGVTISHIAGWSESQALSFGWSAASGLIVLRALTWKALSKARRKGLGLRRTLIVGRSSQASNLSSKLINFPQAGLLPVAMLPLGNGHGFSRFLPDFPSAGQLTRSIQESDADHVVLAPEGGDEAILECVRGAEGLEVSFSILPPLADFFLHPGHVAQVGGMPLIQLGKIAQDRVTLPGKRLFDVIAASLMIMILSPVMLATAIAIKLFDKGPVLYKQRRVGRHGTVFQMLKFRSMVPTGERLEIDLRDRHASMAMLFKVNDAARITPIGHFIRRTAIDELPQLFNVIRGEMSLVGPRPTPGVNPEDFDGIDAKRLMVPPGMTGYWQVSGDNALSYEEMVKLDLAYVENWSLSLDILLILRTIPALLNRLGPS